MPGPVKSLLEEWPSNRSRNSRGWNHATREPPIPPHAPLLLLLRVAGIPPPLSFQLPLASWRRRRRRAKGWHVIHENYITQAGWPRNASAILFFSARVKGGTPSSSLSFNLFLSFLFLPRLFSRRVSREGRKGLKSDDLWKSPFLRLLFLKNDLEISKRNFSKRTMENLLEGLSNFFYKEEVSKNSNSWNLWCFRNADRQFRESRLLQRSRRDAARIRRTITSSSRARENSTIARQESVARSFPPDPRPVTRPSCTC